MSKQLKQWLIAVPVFLLGAGGIIWLMAAVSPRPRIESIGSTLDGQTITVDDLFFGQGKHDMDLVTHTTFDVRTGAIVKTTRDDPSSASSGHPTPPLCTSVHRFERGGKTLRTAPHYGDPDYSAAGLEDPPDTKTVAAVMQPLGFMASAADLVPWLVGNDGLLLYDHGAGIGRFDASGKQIWLRPLGATCEVAVRLGDDTLVVATGDPKARVVAIDLATGAIKWSKSTAAL